MSASKISKKKLLVIQLRPEDRASDSEFRAILRASKLGADDVERLRAEQTSMRGIDLNQYRAIVVGGSPFDVTTPEHKKSQVQKRIELEFQELLDQVVSRDFPFLGACSGNGQLSLYAGGKMSRKYAEPVSGVKVSLTQAGKADKLFGVLPDQFRALVGHKEACEVPPPGAVVLAFSQTCPTQAMRLGKNVYSTQFHPEADVAEFHLRIDIYKDYGYFPAEEAEALKKRIAKEKIVWPAKILEKFVELY